MSRHPYYGDRGEYFWCAVCERVHHGREWELSSWYCPTEGCSGTHIDAFEWEFQRAGGALEQPMDHWPETPVVGRLYPLLDY